jgi:hypothetical protein
MTFNITSLFNSPSSLTIHCSNTPYHKTKLFDSYQIHIQICQYITNEYPKYSNLYCLLNRQANMSAASYLHGTERFLKNRPVLLLLKDFLVFFWNPDVHYVFTSAVHLSLSSDRSIKSIPPHPISLKKKTPWSESASELYRPSDRRLSAK